MAPEPLARGSGEEPGGGATDQMVTGSSPATMSAAERLRLWREVDPEGEGEKDDVQEGDQLTRST